MRRNKMQTLKFEDRESWLEARKGRITGSRLSDIMTKRGNGKKKGFYDLLVEKLGIEDDHDEDARDRGHRLEPESIALYSEKFKKKVDTSLRIWVRDDCDSIAVSPDGSVGKTGGVESKSLYAAKHLEAYLTQKIPSEFEDQTIQYFCANDSLKTLDVLFYHPGVTVMPFFVITIKRKDIEQKVADYLTYQRDTLKEIEEIIRKLTF